MSRNQREGRYCGRIDGKHVRSDLVWVAQYGVSAWLAWRINVNRQSLIPTTHP